MFKWRRLLCLLLVLSLLFSLSVGTANASAATGLLTIASSGGAMGTGVGTFIASALPILPYILVGGIVVYSAVALADDIQGIWEMLSPSAQAELEEISNSGTLDFTMSPALSAELSQATSAYYFDTAGNFIPTQAVTDMREILPVWNEEAHEVYGNTLTSDRYTAPLSTSYTAIPGTPFQIRISDSLVNLHANSLQYLNVATGVTMTFSDTYTNDMLNNLNDECISISVGAPCMTISNSTPDTKRFWSTYLPFLLTCNTVASGGVCDEHTVAYDSYDIRLSGMNGSTYMLFEGTGNMALDGQLFKSYIYDGDLWKYTYDKTYEGNDTITVGTLPFESVCVGEVVNRTYDDTYSFPEAGTTMYLPTAEALCNANTLTRTGSLTGEWDKTIEDNPSIEDEGTNVGFWNKLWDWLAKILEAIRAIPGALWDAIQALIGAITGAITNALNIAFVPSTAFFDTYFADLAATFEGRVGILTYPSAVIYDFFESFLSVGETEPVLTWESWEYQGNTVIPAGSYNLNDVLDYHPVFKTIHDIYLMVVDAMLVIALLRMLQRKYNSIISN